MTSRFRALMTTCGAVLGIVAALPIAAAHPLDPLSASEIALAVDTLRAAGDIDAETRFPLIDLDEPAKAAVLAWQRGQAFARSAFVVARRNRTVYEGVVDLAHRRVERWQAVPGVQPSILESEWALAQRIVTGDPGWRTAMRKRGYNAFDTIFCAPWSAGYSDDPAEAGRRLLKVTCFDTAGTRINVWGRPIEGLYAVVDVDEARVVQLVDGGIVPASRDPADFTGTAAAAARQPRRQPFTVSGSEVRWKNWSFHFRMDRRVGPILSLLRFDDHGRERMVMYRGSISEMFVPYMDPDAGWSFRTYMDVGEYGFGLLSSPLAPGIDCPSDARFIDATLPDEFGKPVAVTSRICLFERDTGNPLWRHAEIVKHAYAGSPAKELVLRTIPAVGNYDYVIDWVLTEAGVMRIDVGATGIDEVKGVTANSMADPSAPGDAAHGTLVAPKLVAVNHDHFLSFRLDVDVDGEGNTLVRRRLAPEQLNGDGARRSLWRVVDEEVGSEGPVPPASHGDAGTWRIVNPSLTNRLGEHPAYELRGEHTVTSLLAADDPPQRRAAFSAAPLWITAYNPGELYAAGPYPNQSKGGDGLPAYAVHNRPVANADIVLWYTMGFHHVPRPEDWPVLSTMWHSISLVPDGFFDRNPSLSR